MRSTIFCIAVLGLALCLPAAAQIQVTVSPSRADVSLGTFLQLSAKVTGTSNTGVSWTVALALPTSKGSPGFISNAGRYTPPETIPDPNVVFVIAASNADPTVYGAAALILGNPYPIP
jgi:chitinase